MQITWDVFVLLVFGAFTIYGALISRSRILGVLINLYIAIAVTLFAGEAIFRAASNLTLITNNFTVTEFGAYTLTTVIITGLLTIKSELSDLDSGDALSKLMAGIYGFLTAGLSLAAIFSYMSYTELINLNSNFALIIMTFAPAFAVAPVLLMIITAFTKRR